LRVRSRLALARRARSTQSLLQSLQRLLPQRDADDARELLSRLVRVSLAQSMEPTDRRAIHRGPALRRGFGPIRTPRFDLAFESRARMILVTGASSNHFSPLKNLLYSLSLFEPKSRVLVYDLGLSLPELEELAASGREIRRFRFED